MTKNQIRNAMKDYGLTRGEFDRQVKSRGWIAGQFRDDYVWSPAPPCRHDRRDGLRVGNPRLCRRWLHCLLRDRLVMNNYMDNDGFSKLTRTRMDIRPFLKTGISMVQIRKFSKKQKTGNYQFPKP